MENIGIFIKLCLGVELLVWFLKRVFFYGEFIGKMVFVLIGKVDLEVRKIKFKIVYFFYEIMG